MVSWPPERDLTLPESSVTVMNPLPALFRTTAFACTAGPPRWPKSGPTRRPEFAFLALLDGAAALPAIPAAAPPSAHSAITAPMRTALERLFILALLSMGAPTVPAQRKSPVGAV